MLSRRVRIGAGLLSGLGATGIAAGLAIVGTSVDVAVPFVDPSGLVLIAPVILVPFAAGAFLRGPAAVAAVVAGTAAAPIAAAFAIDGTCEAGAWIVLGLLVSAILGSATAGLAAFVGDRIGDKPWFGRHRTAGLSVLIMLGPVGLAGWIALAARSTPCA